MAENSERQRCKVVLPIERFTIPRWVKWPPPQIEFETVWAEKISQHQARILNVPFFAKGVSYQDTVATEPWRNNSPLRIAGSDLGDSCFVLFVSSIEHSGNATIRAILVENELADIANAAIKKVSRIGCGWKSGAAGGTTVVSINVPREIGYAKALEPLYRAADLGAIYIDIGFLPSE